MAPPPRSIDQPSLGPATALPGTQEITEDFVWHPSMQQGTGDIARCGLGEEAVVYSSSLSCALRCMSAEMLLVRRGLADAADGLGDLVYPAYIVDLADAGEALAQVA